MVDVALPVLPVLPVEPAVVLEEQQNSVLLRALLAEDD